MKNKRYLFLLILLLVFTLFLVGGSSYALLKGSYTSDNEHIITTGNVSVKLLEKFDNIDKGINVSNDVSAIMNNDYYEFSVTITGVSKVKYKVILENKAPEGFKGRLIPLEYIKVGLEVNGEEKGPISPDITKGVININKLETKESVNYKMRLWFDEKKKDELKNMPDAKAFLKLKVEAEQDI